MMCMMPHMMEHSEHGETHTNASGLSPQDILKRRFALGEITRAQFEEMVQVLSNAETHSAHAQHEINTSN